MVNESWQSRIAARAPLRTSDEVSGATSKYLTSNDTTEEFSDSYREDGYGDDGDYSDRSFHGSAGGVETRRNINLSKRLSRTPTKPPKTAAMSSPSPTSKPNAMCLLAVLGVFVASYYAYAKLTAKLECDFKSLREQYPEQSAEVWKSLSVGIEHILNKVSNNPSVYLMVHKEGKSVKHLIRDIATASSKCFGDMELVEMSAGDFNSGTVKDDFGYAIEKFRSKMKNGKVALIANLNEIPPETARALHSICDTTSPLVTDVVIFLTLKVPVELGTSIRAAEAVLHQLWGSTLKRNELDPLITRVTDQIVQLKN